MEIIAYLVVALAAYLLGSIPTGYLVGLAKGVDIRTVGSGNIGATNVFRFLGKPAGIFVLLMDALKGWFAVRIVALWLAARLLPPEAVEESGEVAAILAALFAVLGHNYTCWLKFKGGKGIATSAGVYLALAPLAVGIALATWIIVFLITRYVSVASIAAAVALPVAVWLTSHSILLGIVTTALGALAIYKHRTNVQRLLAGTEHRFNFKRKGNTT